MHVSRHFAAWTVLFVIFGAAFVFAQGNDIGIGVDSSILRDIDNWNRSCYPKDTCELGVMKNRMLDPPDWTARNCLCDDTCVVYGDCCPDSDNFTILQLKAARERFTCTSLRNYKSNWIIRKCPADWADEETRLKCQQYQDSKEGWKQDSDQFSLMPVTNTNTSITYSNINCAVCNRDPALRHPNGTQFLRMWNPRLECDSIKSNSSFSIANKDNLIDEIHWNAALESWGLNADVDGRGKRFHKCSVDPAVPENVQPYLRPCQEEVIGNCAANWTDKDVEDKCLSYTSFVYQLSSTYRNVHCAVCNHARPGELVCNNTGVSFRNLANSNEFSPSALSLLFDLKDSGDGGTVGQKVTCTQGQLYDPLARKCRQLFCSEGRVLREGRCLNLETTTSTQATTTQTATPPTTTKETTTEPTTQSSTLSTTTTSTTLPSTTTSAGIIFPDDDSDDDEPERPTKWTTTSAAPHLEITHTQSTTPATTTTTKDTTTTTTAATKTTSPAAPREETVPTTTWRATPPTIVDSELNSCPKFALDDTEIEWRENGTVYVVSHNRTFNSNQYLKGAEGGVLICASGLTTVSKFDATLGWVTIIGLGLSVLCLALHLVIFLSNNDRNLSGRNLASLSLALLAAYSSFIGGQFTLPKTPACYAVSVSTFYFFLASFWWMSVLAWDVWRTIRMATVQLRSASGPQWGKFVLYSLYAWFVPALIVAATLVIEYVDVEAWVPIQYHPQFGQSVCWFGQRKALLVYFAAPLTAVLSVNFALFIHSACMIRSTTMSTPTSCNPATSKKQLGLYVRLALIMGLSWVAGLIAGVADVMAVWYIFVALCSLQGVFILLAFSCNPKVMRSLRSRLLFCSNKGRKATYRTAKASGIKAEHLRRLGLEARDSHDSQASNTSQASQTSQTSLTKNNSSSSP